MSLRLVLSLLVLGSGSSFAPPYRGPSSSTAGHRLLVKSSATGSSSSSSSTPPDRFGWSPSPFAEGDADDADRPIWQGKHYDLVVVGGGPVGVQAAVKAGEMGKDCLLIDAPEHSGALMDDGEDLSLGGPTGLFSKALRDTSKRISVSALRGFGLKEAAIWNEIQLVCLELASSNSQNAQLQLAANKVDYARGYARFYKTGANAAKDCSCAGSVGVCKDSTGRPSFISADNVLLATGSKPFRPSSIPFDHQRIFDSDSINGLTFLPRSIAITGSGIIALEYAKIFKSLGADVTLIIRDRNPKTALTKIGLDKDIAAAMITDLTKSGIIVERGAEVAKFEVPQNDKSRSVPIKITLQGARGAERPTNSRVEVKAEAYLAAVGREPNTADLGLEDAGIGLDQHSNIIVTDNLETTFPGVYAAGDVVGRPFLASTGVAQGIAAVGHMFREKGEEDEVLERQRCEGITNGDIVQVGLGSAGASFAPDALAGNPFAFPVGVWTDPEAAYFGLSVQQASDRGIEAGEGLALYKQCLRGCVFSPDGLLKLVFEQPSGRIIGVHIVGDDACELIHYGMELVRAGRTITDVRAATYSAVTFHELYQIAAAAGADPKAARRSRRELGAAWAKQKRERKRDAL